nr:PREDICTED: uncharacterized protein LOC105662050 isoform X1 [Megachile rotundata]
MCLIMLAFIVLSYYFQKAILEESSALHHRRDWSNKKTMPYIANGVIVHQMARQFVHDVNNRCKVPYVLTIMCGVIALSLHFFCLSETVLRTADIRETILSVLLIISTLGYMFWLNLAVEFIIDSACSISLRTYSTNWYETSVATQKLLQLIILNSHKSGFVFNFLCVYVPSMEGFAVVRTISYYDPLKTIFCIEFSFFSF